VKPTAPDRPDVLFLSASVGTGHNAAARALQAAIAQAAPHLVTEWLDVMTLAPWTFRKIYAGGFALAVTRAPHLYGLGFRLTDGPDRPGRAMRERARLAWEGRALRALRRRLLSRPPRLIVHTHFLAPPMVGRLIERGQLDTRQMVVVTDRYAHRFWYAESVAHVFAGSAAVADRLQRWGIDSERITLSGIPIHPKWRAPVDAEAAINAWRLPPDKDIVLLSGGATYTAGPIGRFARKIADACPHTCVCVLCGHNHHLLKSVRRHSHDDDHLRAIPMTDRVHELASVASLFVAKSGGILTTECAVKGLPLVLPRPVPGQERHNARFFADCGAAAVVSHWADVPKIVAALLAAPEARRAMSEAIHALDQPATETICEAIVAALE